MSSPTLNQTPYRVLVLISGRGSNLHAIVSHARQHPECHFGVCAVISNRPHAAGLQFARDEGIATEVIDHSFYLDRESFDHALAHIIDKHNPDLVALAGFMRILSPEFVTRYRGRLINIHPSLLPAYKGLKTHERALAAKESWHGASVHFVTPDLDGGPVILQARVPVRGDDTADSLNARVLRAEHVIYPQAIRWLAEGRVKLDPNGAVLFDGHILPAPKSIDME